MVSIRPTSLNKKHHSGEQFHSKFSVSKNGIKKTTTLRCKWRKRSFFGGVFRKFQHVLEGGPSYIQLQMEGHGAPPNGRK